MRSRIPALWGLVCLIALAGCGSTVTRSTPSAKLRRADGGIPAALLAQERPIGRGERFHPAATGPVSGGCTRTLGRRDEAHVELFGADRVVLLAAGIGTRPPRRTVDGRVVQAACFGDVVTLDPTGTVYFRLGSTTTVGDLFRAWGQPLTRDRVSSFRGATVSVYVDGRRRPGSPQSVPLTQGSEIVLEVGPHVPPHARFVFPELPPPSLS